MLAGKGDGSIIRAIEIILFRVLDLLFKKAQSVIFASPWYLLVVVERNDLADHLSAAKVHDDSTASRCSDKCLMLSYFPSIRYSLLCASACKDEA